MDIQVKIPVENSLTQHKKALLQIWKNHNNFLFRSYSDQSLKNQNILLWIVPSSEKVSVSFQVNQKILLYIFSKKYLRQFELLL